MKRTEKIIALAIVCMMLFVFAIGCAAPAAAPAAEAPAAADAPAAAAPAAEASGEKVTIGVLFDFLSVESRVRQHDEMMRYAAEKNVELVFQNANGDEKVQLQQGENLIAQGVDAIAILAQNADACISLAKQSLEAEIPFIVTDRLISNTDIDYYVGYDNNSIGYTQVNYVHDRMPKGNYVLLSGAPTDPNCKIWHDEWIEVLTPGIDAGDIKVVMDEKCDNWDPNNALKYMENALTASGDQIDVVLCMNDGLGIGVTQALEAAGMDGKVMMTGLDGETVAFQRIAEGKQSMTILIDDVSTARAIIDVCLDAINGVEPETNAVLNNGFEDVPAVYVPLIPVDKDNLMDVIAQGFVDYDVVFENVPEDQRPPRP